MGPVTQEDPIGIAGGLNLYGYAGGDPINYSDPFGLCPPEDENDGPECEDGVILKLQVDAVAAGKNTMGLDRRQTVVPFAGVQANAGVAINLKNGAVAAFAGTGEALGAGKSASMSATFLYGSLSDVVAEGSAEFQVDAPGGFTVPISGAPAGKAVLGLGFSASIGNFVGITFNRWVASRSAAGGQRPSCSFVDAGLGAATCR